jgi:hypothetical protein
MQYLSRSENNPLRLIGCELVAMPIIEPGRTCAFLRRELIIICQVITMMNIA